MSVQLEQWSGDSAAKVYIYWPQFWLKPYLLVLLYDKQPTVIFNCLLSQFNNNTPLIMAVWWEGPTMSMIKINLVKKMLQIREKPDSSARIWWSFQIKVSNEENNFGRKLSRSTNLSAEKENCIDCRVLETTIANIAMIIIFVYVGGGLGAG